MAKGDGDGEVWDAVQEISGAIQWIDEPLIFILPGLRAAFFGQDAVVGVGLVQDLDNLPFRLYVRFTNEIIAFFSVTLSRSRWSKWRSRIRLALSAARLAMVRTGCIAG